MNAPLSWAAVTRPGAGGVRESRAARPERAGLLPDRLAHADEAARRLLARGVFSAVSLAVSRGGVLAHERFFGTTRYAGGEPVTERSLFCIASVTKPLAAAAVLLLVERGLCHLGTPVADLVPEFGRGGKQAVTIEHLLTHTSGISEQWIDAVPYATRDEYLARIRQAPLLWPAGSHVAYCSAGFSALEEVIERTTGTPAAQFLAEALFAPPGMRDTYYRPEEELHARIVECARPNGQDMVREALEVGTLAGAGFSTARDLVRFGNLFLAGGRAAGPGAPQVLSPTGVAAMLLDRTSHLPSAPGTPPGVRRFGLGWVLARPALWACDLVSPRAFGHPGSSGAYLIVDPTYDLVVALLANRWGGDPTGMAEVLNGAVAAVAADERGTAMGRSTPIAPAR